MLVPASLGPVLWYSTLACQQNGLDKKKSVSRCTCQTIIFEVYIWPIKGKVWNNAFPAISNTSVQSHRSKHHDNPEAHECLSGPGCSKAGQR